MILVVWLMFVFMVVLDMFMFSWWFWWSSSLWVFSWCLGLFLLCGGTLGVRVCVLLWLLVFCWVSRLCCSLIDVLGWCCAEDL